MSRLSAVKSLTRGALCSSRLALGHRLLVRYLSDDSDSAFVQPTDQIQEKSKKFKKQKPSGEPSHLFVWPDVKEKNIYHTEASECADDGITATWDFKNNELDVEELAGLPCPSECEDPFATFEAAEESFEEAEHQNLQDELQFGRMRALREQLTKEIDSSEAFTSDKLSSLTSVRENVDFMMQELTQISSLLNTLYPEQANATTCSASHGLSQQDNVMGTAYSEPQVESWLYQDSSASAAPKEDMVLEESKEDLEDFKITSEAEAISNEVEMSSDQETEAEDEVICADDSSEKSTPAKPTESSPKTDGRQEMQPKEAIHTYRPFRTIEVPANKPARGLSSQAAPLQEQEDVVGSVDNPPMDQDYIVSTQLSATESRVLMRMALKQALHDLESGQNNYKATVLMANDEESHAED